MCVVPRSTLGKVRLDDAPQALAHIQTFVNTMAGAKPNRREEVPETG
jgi:hypothetical protein